MATIKRKELNQIIADRDFWREGWDTVSTQNFNLQLELDSLREEVEIKERKIGALYEELEKAEPLKIELNALREEVDKLQSALTVENENCARLKQIWADTEKSRDAWYDDWKQMDQENRKLLSINNALAAMLLVHFANGLETIEPPSCLKPLDALKYVQGAFVHEETL
jgi:chromosome segregation ATPase